MSGQIKIYHWLPWAVAAGIVAVIGMAVSSYHGYWIFQFEPWNNATDQVVKMAISEFRDGIPDLGPYWKERIWALAGMLVLFIIGPSLWIFGEIHNEAKKTSSKDEELKKGLVWYAGVIVLISGLSLTVVSTVMKGVSFNPTWENADQSRNLDNLRSELVRMAFQASELYYLSKGTNDAGGFRAIQEAGGQVRPITLEDLDIGDSPTQNTYVLAPIESEDVITIYGIGYLKGSDSEFENANGDKGKIQRAINVTPLDGIIQWVDSGKN